MARYRPICCLIWNDDKFPFASDDCQLVWFHLFTNPMSSPLGIYKASLAGLAEEKRWPLKRYLKAFQEAFAKGFVEHDPNARLVYFPKFFKEGYANRPPNPNVLKNWGKIFHELPESPLKVKCYQRLKALAEGLGEGFKEAFRKGFGEGLPKGYANTGTVTGTVTGTEKTPFAVSDKKNITQPPMKIQKIEFGSTGFEKISSQDKETWKKAYPTLKIDQELVKMEAWVIANPQNRKSNWRRFIVNWLSRAQDSASTRDSPRTGGMSREEAEVKYGKIGKVEVLGNG